MKNFRLFVWRLWTLGTIYLDGLIHNHKKWKIFINQRIFIKISCDIREFTRSFELVEKEIEKVRTELFSALKIPSQYIK